MLQVERSTTYLCSAPLRVMCGLERANALQLPVNKKTAGAQGPAGLLNKIHACWLVAMVDTLVDMHLERTKDGR
jgi:hypothetical protein